MVEKIIVNTKVRALGNIVEPKITDDYVKDHSALTVTTDTVSGETMSVFRMDKVQKSSEMTVTLSETNVVPPTDVRGTIFLVDNEGDTLTGEVKLYIGTTYWSTVQVLDGAGSFTIRFSYEGSYPIRCVYDGEQFVTGTQTTNTVTVTKQSSTLTSNDFTKYYNETGTITATLMIDNQVASGKEVLLSLGNVTYRSTTNTNGVASFTIGTVLNAGTYTGTLSYAGTQSITESTTTIRVAVLQHTTNITATYSPVTVVPGETSNITVTLTDNLNNPVASVPVKMYLDTTLIRTLTTNSNGVATTTYSNDTEGRKHLVWTFEGNTNYATKSLGKNLIVSKQSTNIISTSPINKGYYDTQDITARLQNTTTSENMANETLTFTINGTTTTATTNSNGVATYTIGTLPAGTYTLGISYAGTNIIKSYTRNVTVNVGSITTVLMPVSSTKSVTVGTGTFEARLIYDDGVSQEVQDYPPLANKGVKFTVNGVSYNRTTNNNGVATLDVSNLSVGTYTVGISFLGQDNYGASSSSGTLIVTNKAPISISIDDPILLAPNTTCYVPVTITSNGNPVANKKVDYITNAASYNPDGVRTNSNGVAQLELITQSETSAQMMVSVDEDSTYAGAVKYVTVNVYEYYLTGRIVQVVQSRGIFEWTIYHNGAPEGGLPVRITYPDGTIRTINSDANDGTVYIDDATVRGDYIASYRGAEYTITF